MSKGSNLHVGVWVKAGTREDFDTLQALLFHIKHLHGVHISSYLAQHMSGINMVRSVADGS